MKTTPLTNGVTPNGYDAATSSSLSCIVSKSMLAFMVAQFKRLASALASATSLTASVSSVNMSSYVESESERASTARLTSAILALTARILASAAINRSVFPI